MEIYTAYGVQRDKGKEKTKRPMSKIKRKFSFIYSCRDSNKLFQKGIEWIPKLLDLFRELYNPFLRRVKVDQDFSEYSPSSPEIYEVGPAQRRLHTHIYG